MTTSEDTLGVKEKNRAVFDGWIDKIASEGEVDFIDKGLVYDIIVSLGAKPEISVAAAASLGKYSNLRKRVGLNEVWGEDRVSAYKGWVIDRFIPGIEAEIGAEFPTLYDPKTKKYDDPVTDNTKYTGSLQFLGEITAYAYGSEAFDDLNRHLKRRAEKGLLWAQGDYKPSDNHPFPPGLPLAAIDWLRQTHKAK